MNTHFYRNEIQVLAAGRIIATARLEQFDQTEHSTGWLWVGKEGHHAVDKNLPEGFPIWVVNAPYCVGLALDLERAMAFIEKTLNEKI